MNTPKTVLLAAYILTILLAVTAVRGYYSSGKRGQGKLIFVCIQLFLNHIVDVFHFRKEN